MSAVCSSYFIFLVFVAVHLTFSLRILKISWHVKNEHFTLKNPNGKCLLDIYIWNSKRRTQGRKKKEQNTNNQKYARNKQWWKCYENILWLIPFEEQSEGVEIVVNSVFRLVVVVYSCCLSSFATAPIPFLLSVCVFQCQHISLPLAHSLVLLSMIINEAHNLRQSYHTLWSPYSITFACNTSQFSRFMHIRRKYCQVIGVTVDDWTIKRI